MQEYIIASLVFDRMRKEDNDQLVTCTLVSHARGTLKSLENHSGPITIDKGGLQLSHFHRHTKHARGKHLVSASFCS